MRNLLRTQFLLIITITVFLLTLPCPGQESSTPTNFTKLEPLPAPRILNSADSYPGGNYGPANLLDGKIRSEYSSNGKGTNTFVEFDFGTPAVIAAFSHLERNDPATIASSELTFMDGASKALGTTPITHVNERGGQTFHVFSSPITAQRVRWQITRLGAGLGTVGGAEILFYTAGKSESSPTALKLTAKTLQLEERRGETTVQPVKVALTYPYAEPVDAILKIEGTESKPIHLTPGDQSIQILVPAVASQKQFQIQILVANQAASSLALTQMPVRPMQIFLLPHSHVDIGYTALQADVEKKQNSNIETGLRLATNTADYPEGARFKWNTEVLWPVENYLRDATPQKREAFIAAVRSGQIGLDALYGNTLTGLCRPEELLNLMGYATRLSKLCGVPIESAMISDVPGYTWSIVSAMAQAGVKYFSFAPNYFDRMGGTMKEWQNRPFWWKGADGKNRVLCWCPSRGYALGHLIGDGEALARFIPSYLEELETNSYPYDITHLRWNVHGDNGSPDEKLADVVRSWNERYVHPKLIISTTAAAFRQFEQAYGNRLPEFSGDYTPYWEDGAASSALETALNRASAERLVQAETLWSMQRPGPFPAEVFQAVWRNILLYSEHTWGAHNSIGEPDLPFVRDQWRVKREFALEADRQSRELLQRAGAFSGHSPVCAEGLAPKSNVEGASLESSKTNSSSLPQAGGRAIDVLNTSSWRRTDLVTLSPEDSTAGDQVTNERGSIVPSQRLASGELVFLARNVPAFGSSRFRIGPGTCPLHGFANVENQRLISSSFFVRINAQSGAIEHLFSRSLGRELVDPKAATALNDFFYLPGSDLNGLQRNGVPQIRVKENGPLVASLLIESEAPGCRRLMREVRVIDGLDRLEIINTIDKLPVRAKEGIHFGWGFDIPNGTMRMDVGWAAVRPELDQIPASCKNWFSIQRWLDISNDRFGVTWSPIDAPLVEVSAITAKLVGSQTDYRAWIQHLNPSQTIYSWVMNNHWHTNYRADQEGPTVFRYAIYPHKGFAADEAARFGISCSQPLLVANPANSLKPQPRLKLSSNRVLVSALKPSDDGRGTIVRLFGASGKAERVKLSWADPVPHRLWLSDLSEEPAQEIGNSVEVPGWGIVTLRAE